MDDKIKEKIRSLLNKTVENGASEAEALAAIEAAYKLMNKHGLNEADILDAKEKNKYEFFYAHQFNKGGSGLDNFIAKSVAALAGVAVFTHKDRLSGKHIIFFGEHDDCDFASMVRNCVFYTFQKEYRKFLKTGVERDYHVKKTFEIAYGARIRSRIKQMIEESIKGMIESNQVSSTGTALIVLKNQIVTEALANQMKLKAGKAKNYLSGKEMTDAQKVAYMAGQAAGDKAIIPLNSKEANARSLMKD